MAKIVDIDISLEGVILSRLEQKEYDKSFTEIPNDKLPENLFNNLQTVYMSLTGAETMPLTDSTFTVKAKEDGDIFTFQRLYSPTVFKAEPEDQEPYLYISWGSTDITLNENDGVLSTETGVSFKLRAKKIGKYEVPSLIATVKVGKETYSMSFPLRLVELETDPDELEILLESSFADFLDAIGGKGSGNFKTFSGHTVKTGQLPLGEFTITDYRSWEHPKYGVRYYLQAEAPEVPFPATVGVKDEQGEWQNVEVEITEAFQIRSNNAVKRYMESKPVINAEMPATLTVTEKGEFNGYETASVVMKMAAFEEDAEAIDLDF